MGMFDDVKAPDVPCPKCGKPINGWQSKDGDCTLDLIPFETVDRFYSSCRKCEVYIEFRYKTKPVSERTIDDYEIIVELPDEPKSRA